MHGPDGTDYPNRIVYRVKFGAIEGGEQTLARLDRHVATMSPVG